MLLLHLLVPDCLLLLGVSLEGAWARAFLLAARKLVRGRLVRERAAVRAVDVARSHAGQRRARAAAAVEVHAVAPVAAVAVRVWVGRWGLQVHLATTGAGERLRHLRRARWVSVVLDRPREVAQPERVLQVVAVASAARLDAVGAQLTRLVEVGQRLRSERRG